MIAQPKMGEQRTGIRRVPKMFIQSVSDKPVVLLDKNRAGEILAQGVNRRPSDDDARKQQRQTKSRDEIAARHTPDVGETQDHSH